MLNDLNTEKYTAIYIALGYTDLRLGIDGLAAKIESEFGMDPFKEGTIFLFCGRKTDRIKGLLWEDDGFLLLYKRLENGRFQWPRNIQDVNLITPQEYRWLMEGLTIYQKKKVLPASKGKFI